MRTHRSAVLFGVLAAGVLLTQQACASVDQRPGAPVAFAAPADEGTSSSAAKPAGFAAPAGEGTPSSAAKPVGSAKNPILAGKRQVVIRPIQSTESILAVDARGRLDLTDGEAEHGLFVLAPAGDKYLIKTAKVGAGGEPSCMGVKNNGSGPLTVVAADCDAGRAGQLFTITRQKGKGVPAYAISNQGAFLQVFGRTGLIAEELGDAPLKTTFAFVDNGPSQL